MWPWRARSSLLKPQFQQRPNPNVLHVDSEMACLYWKEIDGYEKENSPAGEVTEALIESLATMEAVNWQQFC
jgi:hypothetical protein